MVASDTDHLFLATLVVFFDIILVSTEQHSGSRLLTTRIMPHANLSFLVAATFLLAAAVEARAEKECCAEKKVGSVDYTLWPAGAFQGQIPDSCLNNCVYTITGTANPKFCFKTGSVTRLCDICVIFLPYYLLS